MIGRYPSVIVEVTGTILAPFIMLFGIYVILHGHYGPGGGFAGGVVLAVGVILLRLVADEQHVDRRFPPAVGIVTASIGMLLFLVVGLASVAFGGAFLEYGAVGPDEVTLRYYGILVVEVAVGLAVFGTILVIFDVLSAKSEGL